MKASKPYFSHDIAAKSDEKIIRLMFDFRKTKNEFSESTLKDLVAHAAYGIYWEIIEYLHENNLNIDELDMLADELRVDADILSRILKNYDLFKQTDGKYISERVLRNLKLQEEKSEKARQSANKRHNRGKGKEEVVVPEADAAPAEEAPEYNDKLVMSIIQIYNKKFNKSQIVSNINKQKIFDIHTKNKLSFDTWEKIFGNAKRGWDIGDKKNVPPSLKKILEEWDSFASDDYFLAPDRESLAMLRKKQEREEEQIREAERLEREREQQEYNATKEAIHDKKSAIAFINKYIHLPEKMLPISTAVKEFSKQYNFTIEELIAARTNERGEEVESRNSFSTNVATERTDNE